MKVLKNLYSRHLDICFHFHFFLHHLGKFLPQVLLSTTAMVVSNKWKLKEWNYLNFSWSAIFNFWYPVPIPELKKAKLITSKDKKTFNEMATSGVDFSIS